MARVKELKMLREYFAKQASREIDMGAWSQEKGFGPFCRTAKCLGGWAASHLVFYSEGLQLNGPRLYFFKNGMYEASGYEAFQQFFEITEDECEYLCDPDSYGCGGKFATKEQVLERLDALIEKYEAKSQVPVGTPRIQLVAAE